MRQHGHGSKESIISVLPCGLHVNTLLIVQVQVGQFFSSFIKGHKVLNIVHDGNARQGLLQVISKAFPILWRMKQAIHIVEDMFLSNGSRPSETVTDFFQNPIGYAVATDITIGFCIIKKRGLRIFIFFIPIQRKALTIKLYLVIGHCVCYQATKALIPNSA